MKITTPSIKQLERNKPRNKCRTWQLIGRYKKSDGSYGEKTKVFHGTVTEAKFELDRYIDMLENGEGTKYIKFCDYSKDWLDYRIKLNSFSPNTLSNNKCTIDRLNELFGDYYLHELTPKIIKDKLVDLKLKQKSGNTQASNSYKLKFYKTLKTILKSAILDEYIERDPMQNIQMPKNDTKERIALSKAQFDYVIDLLNKRKLNGFNVAIQLLLYLGLRRGEVVALTWDDYDREKRTITINHALKEKGKCIAEPKSKCSKRTLPLSRNVYNLIERWHEEYSKYPNDTNFICCNNALNLMQPQTLYRWWAKTIVESNNKRVEATHQGIILPKICLHELRHTNLTLVARHMSPFDLQTYAGWSDLGPAKIYIHKDQNAMKRGLENADL